MAVALGYIILYSPSLPTPKYIYSFDNFIAFNIKYILNEIKKCSITSFNGQDSPKLASNK